MTYQQSKFQTFLCTLMETKILQSWQLIKFDFSTMGGGGEERPAFKTWIPLYSDGGLSNGIVFNRFQSGAASNPNSNNAFRNFWEFKFLIFKNFFSILSKYFTNSININHLFPQNFSHFFKNLSFKKISFKKSLFRHVVVFLKDSFSPTFRINDNQSHGNFFTPPHMGGG